MALWSANESPALKAVSYPYDGHNEGVHRQIYYTMKVLGISFQSYLPSFCIVHGNALIYAAIVLKFL